MTRSERELAERIRQALLATAQAAHDDAGIRGLCCEGQWEAVVTALRNLDLASIIASRSGTLGEGGPPGSSPGDLCPASPCPEGEDGE